jgi:hypothetical protein
MSPPDERLPPPSLEDPLAHDEGETSAPASTHARTLAEARALQQRPLLAGGVEAIARQHRRTG